MQKPNSGDSEIICDKGCNLRISRQEYEVNNCITHVQNLVKKLQEQISLLTLSRQFEQIPIHGNELSRWQPPQQQQLQQQCASNSLVNDAPKFHWQNCKNIHVSINHTDVLVCGNEDSVGFAQSIYPVEPGNSSFRVLLLNEANVCIGMSPINYRRGNLGKMKDSFGFYTVYDGTTKNYKMEFWVNNLVFCMNNIRYDKVITRSIEFGIRLPPNFVNDGNYSVEMYVRVDDKLIKEQLIKMPQYAIFPTIELFGPGNRVKYSN